MDSARACTVARWTAAVVLVCAVVGVVLAYRDGPFWLTSLLVCSMPLLAACALYLGPPRQTSRLSAYRAALRKRQRR